MLDKLIAAITSRNASECKNESDEVKKYFADEKALQSDFKIIIKAITPKITTMESTLVTITRRIEFTSSSSNASEATNEEEFETTSVNIIDLLPNQLRFAKNSLTTVKDYIALLKDAAVNHIFESVWMLLFENPEDIDQRELISSDGEPAGYNEYGYVFDILNILCKNNMLNAKNVNWVAKLYKWEQEQRGNDIPCFCLFFTLYKMDLLNKEWVNRILAPTNKKGENRESEDVIDRERIILFEKIIFYIYMIYIYMMGKNSVLVNQNIRINPEVILNQILPHADIKILKEIEKIMYSLDDNLSSAEVDRPQFARDISWFLQNTTLFSSKDLEIYSLFSFILKNKKKLFTESNISTLLTCNREIYPYLLLKLKSADKMVSQEDFNQLILSSKMKYKQATMFFKKIIFTAIFYDDEGKEMNFPEEEKQKKQSLLTNSVPNTVSTFLTLTLFKNQKNALSANMVGVAEGKKKRKLTI